MTLIKLWLISNNLKTIVIIHGRGGDPYNFDYIIRHFIKNNKIFLKDISIPDGTQYNIFVPFLGDTSSSSIKEDANILLQKLQLYNISLENFIGGF